MQNVHKYASYMRHEYAAFDMHETCHASRPLPPPSPLPSATYPGRHHSTTVSTAAAAAASAGPEP